LLAEQEVVVAPGAYDVFSALLIEKAGFECVYLTGNGQAASALGLPDLGLITLAEMVERTRQTSLRTSLPLIADADDGYGSVLLLQRAVRELEAVGADAIQIEDQVSPKKCGHELGRQTVSIDDMVTRIRAACAARASADTLIIARTDARTMDGLDEAIRRGNEYHAAGADVIFVESPESEDEFAEIARRVSAPKLANMVEGGRSPYLSWRRLGELGFDIVIYPLTTILAAAGGAQRALEELMEAGRADKRLREMLMLDEYHELVDFYRYQQAENEYRLATSSQSGRD
jgi:2-methylisocitrate lyase-like PEP mutase family enzyme